MRDALHKKVRPLGGGIDRRAAKRGIRQLEDRQEDLVRKHFYVLFVIKLWVAADLVCRDELGEDGDGLSEFGGQSVEVEVCTGILPGSRGGELRLGVRVDEGLRTEERRRCRGSYGTRRGNGA